jgi:hypothetical protein
MLPARTPDQLLELARKLHRNGAIGFLLSGGFELDGKLPVTPFLAAIAKIKSETNLIINIHPGLLNSDEIAALADAGVDIVSIDVVGSTDTIQKILGLNKTVVDYALMLKAFACSKIPVIVPHILIGREQSKLDGELNALELISASRLRLDALVLLSLNPIKASDTQSFVSPSPRVVSEVIKCARAKFPTVPIYLGCMRDRRNPYLEQIAIESGVDGIVVPSNSTLRYARAQDIEIIKVEACCAVPLSLLAHM